MNLQEGIEKLTALFSKHGIEVKNEQKENVQTKIVFETAKLNDGVTQIEWDGDLMTGTIVFILDSKGSKLPLPVGQYVLEDGTTFDVVDENGTADNVVMAETETEDMPALTIAGAPAPVKATEVPAAPKRVIKSQVEEHVFSLEIEGIEPIVVDFKPMFEKIENENKELKEKLTIAENFNRELANVVAEIADQPAKEATEAQSKTKFSVSEFRKEYKTDLQKHYK